MNVKEHFKRHKTTYLVAGTAVTVAGITYLIMRGTGAQRVPGVEGAQRVPANTASFIFKNKQTVNVTTVLEREGRGHPGWPVKNLETKHVFLSQNAAAEAFDINPGVLSGHLTGKFPDANGLHFERVNLAALS